MTKFKVGDRVRLTGDAWRNHGLIGEVHVVENIVGGLAHIAAFGRGFAIYRDAMDYSATLVEHAPPPPPDTRKRLREYTDLADGDVVVIAGVDFVFVGSPTDGMVQASRHSYQHRGGSPVADMLVDEVRRKPRTKKRRVYEEVDAKDAREGDLLENDRDPRVRARLSDWDGDPSDLEGATVLRLIEETEVPR